MVMVIVVLKILKHHNLRRMITFLLCNASLSTKNFIIDKDGEMKCQLAFAPKAPVATKTNCFKRKRLLRVVGEYFAHFEDKFRRTDGCA